MTVIGTCAISRVQREWKGAAVFKLLYPKVGQLLEPRYQCAPLRLPLFASSKKDVVELIFAERNTPDGCITVGRTPPVRDGSADRSRKTATARISRTISAGVRANDRLCLKVISGTPRLGKFADLERSKE